MKFTKPLLSLPGFFLGKKGIMIDSGCTTIYDKIGIGITRMTKRKPFDKLREKGLVCYRVICFDSEDDLLNITLGKSSLPLSECYIVFVLAPPAKIYGDTRSTSLLNMV
ncbi:hypothetical protein ACFL1A_03475 [Patescibacteria group bacterium]